QAMVNFGMDGSRRVQALTISALTHLFFIGSATAAIYFGRHLLATFFSMPELSDVLLLFPLVSLGFLLRNYFLKISQLHIDTRATFVIDLVWVISTVGLLIAGWRMGWLATADDMMKISAVASALSSLTGLLLFGRHVR